MVKESSIALILNKVAGLILFVFLLIFHIKKLYWTSVFTMYIIFILYALLVVSFFIVADINASFITLKTMVQILFLAFVLYNLFIYEYSFIKISRVLIIVSIVAFFGGIFGLVENVFLDDELVRIKGISSNSNTLAFFLLYGFISSLYLISKKKVLSKMGIILEWSTIILYAFLLNNTGSRKSFLTFLAILLYYIITKYKFKKIITMGVLTGGVLLMMPFIWNYIAYETLIGRRFMINEQIEGGREVRLELYRDSFAVFLDNPILGIGLSNFQFHSETGHVAHSYYMEVLANTGIIGFLMILSIYIIIYRKIRAVKRNFPKYKLEVRFGYMFLIMVFVISFGFHMYSSIHHWVIIAVVLSFFEKLNINNETYSNYR